MQRELTSTIALLSSTPAAMTALLGNLPDELLHTTEGEGTWTIAQVLAHLIHGERTDWLPRIQIILRSGEAETFPAFQREAHLSDTRPIRELLGEFAALRTVSLDQLRELRLTEQDLERRGTHPVFGTVTLGQLLATWSTHDLTHLHQISRILAAQSRDAVGPWSRFLGVLHCDGHSSKA